MKPGSFVFHPAFGHHYDGAKDEDVIVQIMGMGPVKTVNVEAVPRAAHGAGAAPAAAMRRVVVRAAVAATSKAVTWRTRLYFTRNSTSLEAGAFRFDVFRASTDSR